MPIDEFSTQKLSRRIDSIVGDVQSAFKVEKGEDYDVRLVKDSLRECVAKKIEHIEESMLETFTSPGRNEFHELAGVLAERSSLAKGVEVEETVALANEFGDEGVFNGYRVFSRDKLAAMMEYLTSKGHHVYKTSLNKLLFYSDLTNFYLLNRGMSGTVYHNRPYGPVADPAAPILRELIDQDRVVIAPRTQTLQAGDTAAPNADVLTDDERKVLDWVAETYGPMTAGQVSEFSHKEMAYKNTEPNQPIAYAYAQFLKLLPPKNLLDQ